MPEQFHPVHDRGLTRWHDTTCGFEIEVKFLSLFIYGRNRFYCCNRFSIRGDSVRLSLI
jgi:hypothetical protein